MADKILKLSFYLLLFFVPLILSPYTSEIFEFNKMVLTYALTIVIVSAWIGKSIAAKNIIFRKTLIDIPLLIFIGVQTISTLISIDPRTSLLGYYSRFHGGLLSTLCYSALYWAYVSNFNSSDTRKIINYSLLPSALIVSLYGILQHFGIDKHIWVQDVQNRIFSTLGQPNWLAAWIAATLPITWAFSLYQWKMDIGKWKNSKQSITYHLLTTIFFITLLFTKSRSGILGFAVADIVFWSGIFFAMISWKINRVRIIRPFLISHFSFLIFIIIIGTPWTPNMEELLNKDTSSITNQVSQTAIAPALELGGSSSIEIRKIVWHGAWDIWKNYPIFGSGVETFAFAYYQFRPVEHNNVSEWDFLYNKAHNEYLNFMATTGTVGILAYFTLIGSSLIQIIKISKNLNIQLSEQRRKETKLNEKTYSEFGDLEFLRFGVLAGYASILVTNFFGFSVVPVALLFFLYPALAISIQNPDKNNNIGDENLNTGQKVAISAVLILSLIILSQVYKYWKADLNYSNGKSHRSLGNYQLAEVHLNKAVSMSPKESIFWDELSQTLAEIAAYLEEAENNETAIAYAGKADEFGKKAIHLSPANVNLKRSFSASSIKMAAIDQNYLNKANLLLLEAIEKAPTDSKLYYNLALTYLRMNDLDKAEEIFKKTIELRPGYKAARLALGYVYIDKGQHEKAREELNYILEKIDPNDELIKKELSELESS